MEQMTAFDQLTQAVKAIYPNQEGIYYKTAIPARLGGDNPLDGVEV